VRRLVAFARRLAALLGQERRERELADELASHLTLHIEDNLRAGMTSEEARRKALLRLGGIEQTKEAYRERRGLPLLETLWQDLRFAARMLCKNPGFTTVAVLTLALGIGANTAVCSIVNAVILRPLPYKDSSRMVTFEMKAAAFPNLSLYLSWPAFQAIRDNADSLEQIVACWEIGRTLTGTRQPAVLNVAGVSAGFFEEMSARAQAGRLLSDQDQKPAQNHVAVISNAVWRTQFGAHPATIDRQIILDNQTYTVVGIAAKTFSFPERNDVWIPLALTSEDQRNPAFFGIEGVARLRKGARLPALQAQLDTISQRLSEQLEKEKPDLKVGYHISAQSLLDSRVRDAQESYLVLLAAATFVLLIACANLTSLLLARGWGRHREMAMRAAIGASPARLQRQCLVESCLLSLLGGVIGIAMAACGVEVFRLVAPAGTARLNEVSTDWTLMWFALASSLMSGVAFGLIPARRASRMTPNELLKQGTGGSAAGRSRFGNTLVVVEVALAFILLIGSTLMTQTLAHLLHQDPGFRTDHVLTLDLPQKTKWFEKSSEAEVAKQVATMRQLLIDVRQLPGVESVVAADHGMLNGVVFSNAGIKLEGALPEYAHSPVGISARFLSPRYFQTFGIPLLRGREFGDSDVRGAQKVIVINETMARHFWGTLEVIGKRVSVSKDSKGVPVWNEIVGVVTDIRDLNIQSEPEPEYYLALFQWGVSSHHLVVRTLMNPDSLADTISRRIWASDPDQPVTHVSSMTATIAESIGDQRLHTTLLGIFAAIGLTLALLGVYGVVSYSVARRTQEIGVRMALGAGKAEVWRMVLRQGLTLVAIGAAVGTAGALGAVRVIASELYGVKPSDPWTYAGGIALILLVGCLACWVPARRAMGVDPMVALRHD
jgi:putative ABC transport system permease protein